MARRSEVARDLRRVFDGDEPAEAERRRNDVVDRYQKTAPAGAVRQAETRPEPVRLRGCWAQCGSPHESWRARPQGFDSRIRSRDGQRHGCWLLHTRRRQTAGQRAARAGTTSRQDAAANHAFGTAGSRSRLARARDRRHPARSRPTHCRDRSRHDCCSCDRGRCKGRCGENVLRAFWLPEPQGRPLAHGFADGDGSKTRSIDVAEPHEADFSSSAIAVRTLSIAVFCWAGSETLLAALSASWRSARACFFSPQDAVALATARSA